jgi:hypothetical protein
VQGIDIFLASLILHKYIYQINGALNWAQFKYLFLIHFFITTKGRVQKANLVQVLLEPLRQPT